MSQTVDRGARTVRASVFTEPGTPVRTVDV
jgi:S-(hydroxymethyl)glutathione dehydrogenase/alcohol dehydrogenase